MAASHERESFRGLLLRHRGRTGLIQRDLAARAGVGLRSVQDWESGVTLPSAERLQRLLGALLAAGGLTRGLEETEARQLWATAEQEAPRMRTPFDAEWFARILLQYTAPGDALTDEVAPKADGVAHPAAGRAERAQDWGEAPDTAGFVGRADELAQLRDWVLDQRSRLIAVLGMGGIGKTTLAARLAQMIAPGFERLYWRSLRNAPPVNEWLAGAIGFISDQRVVPPVSESECINTLLQLLRDTPCLLVLDNSETLFESGRRESRYRSDMEGYGRLFQAIGGASHRSCLLLTSREAPPELALLTGVHALELHGLGSLEAQALLADKRLDGDARTWTSLVDRYGGNGLALKIVGETISQVYGGDVSAFLRDAIDTYGTVFGGIRRLLENQVERLSPVERDILTRLAVEREAISLSELARDMAPNVARSTVVDAIESLRRRSLVERGERGATFTLQSMVLEYITDQLVDTIANEIDSGESLVILQQPVIKAQSKDYVRQTQERLIGGPVLQLLNNELAEAGAASRLNALLDGWRGRPAADQGYGPGNVVNLLRMLQGDLRNTDLSRLVVRQAYLPEAQDASLAGSHLTDAVLADAFADPTAVALSADGALLAAGTTTGEVWLWSAADRTLLLAAHAHTGAVWGVTLAQDPRSAGSAPNATGQLMASSGVDGLINLWELPYARPRLSWQGHIGEVRGLVMSHDGRLLASCGVDGVVKLWRTPSGELLSSMQGHDGAVWGVAFSPDGRFLASGGGDTTVRLWEPGSGQLLATMHGHDGLVYSVALAGDASLLASGSADGTVRLWDRSGRALASLSGHSGAVRGVAFSGDGRLVVSGSNDATLRVWDPGSGQSLASLQGHAGAVRGVALSEDGQLLASASWDGTVRLWEPASGRPLATLQGQTCAVRAVAFSTDGQLLASGGVGGTVELWQPGNGELLGLVKEQIAAVWSLAFSGDSHLLASGGGDGAVRLWEPRSRRLVATLRGHTGAVMGVALSGDGRLVAGAGLDQTVRLWEAPSGRPLATLHGHTGPVRGVAFSGDGRLLASGSWDGTLRLWGAGSGQLLHILHGHTGVVYGVAFSTHGELLASGGVDGTVRLWEPRLSQCVAVLQGHTGAVCRVALSADGRLLASASFDGTVRLWEPASGRLLATLQGHTGVVWGVALSPDGLRVASGGDDGTVRVWDARSGTLLRTQQPERRYERLNITGLTGVTEVQRAALFALGAIETSAEPVC